jgi:hypothetical protein
MTQIDELIENISVFDAWPTAKKIIWLSALISTLTMFARITYEVGTDAVCSPKTLRKMNEIIHRASGYQCALSTERKTYTATDFLHYLKNALAEAHIDQSEVRRAMEWCYKYI